MTVYTNKPAFNVREKLKELDKPSGIAGEAMLRAETSREQQNLIGAGRKNLIINGDFRVSQRGDYTSATGTTHNTIYADRWVVRLDNVTANIQHILGTNAAPGYPYKDSNSLRLTATSDGNGRIRHLQRVEGFLSGRTLTISAWVKSNSSDARVFSYQHNGGYRVSSKPHSGNGEWEYLTLTTLNDATAANQLYFDIALATESFGNTTITSGDYVEISEVQMEVGSVATPFEYRSYGEELALCQRYCYVIGNPTQVIYLGSGSMYTTTAVNLSVPLPVQLRHSSPSFTVQSNSSNLWLNVYVGANGFQSNATPLQGDYTQSNLRIYIPGAHNGTNSFVGAGVWSMVLAGAKLIVNAEF